MHKKPNKFWKTGAAPLIPLIVGAVILVSTAVAFIYDEQSRVYRSKAATCPYHCSGNLCVPGGDSAKGDTCITDCAVCGGGGSALWTANKLDYNNVLVVGAERLLANKISAIYGRNKPRDVHDLYLLFRKKFRHGCARHDI